VKKTARSSTGQEESETPFPAVLGSGTVHRPQGQYVPVKDTVRSFKAILDGSYDDLPEAAFMSVGTIEDVVEKAEKLK